MAFAVKYRMDFTDVLEQDTYRIDVEIDNYVGDVILLGHTFEGFTLTYNENDWVQGFEGVFSFYSDISDVTDYDADFYDRQYKEVKVKFYINSTLKNVGWLKPENTVREFHYPAVEYKVSFTDGLNDLKEIDYVNSDGTTDTLLEIIKRAINLGGLTDFDFFIQCNIVEDDLMNTSTPPNLFNVFTAKAAAFYTDESNERVYDSCFDVLEKCIKSFYCRLAQVNGYWQITNGQEHESERDVYAFSDLSAVSENSVYDRTVDISDFAVAGSKFELTKLPPVDTLQVTHLNKYIGTNELSNSDFSSGTANWNNGDSTQDWETFSGADGRLLVGDDVSTGGNPNEAKVFYSDTFNIADIGTGDGFFHWRIALELVGIVYSNGDYASFPPFIAVQLTYPNGDVVSSGYEIIRQGFNSYQLAFEETFPVDQVGDYFLSVFYAPPNPDGELSSIQLSFDEIILIQTSAESDPVDKVYRFFSDVPGFLKLKEEVHFGDGDKASDAGVLMDIDNNFSSSWSRRGFTTDGVTLIELFGKQFLNDRKGYFDRITIEGLIDYDEEIHFNSILILRSKRYRFTEFSKNFKTKQISGTIQQVQNDTDAEFTQLIRSYLSKSKFFQGGGAPPPAATEDRAGLVTTLPQTFSGTKTFDDGFVLSSNTLLVTPIPGRFEYDGTDLWFTNNSSIRTKITGLAGGGAEDGTYTPTVSNTSNTDSVTPNGFRYVQVGDVVTIDGWFIVDPTAASEVTFEFDLPVASNLSVSNFEVTGTGVAGSGTGVVYINGVPATDTIRVRYTPASTSSHGISVHVSYLVV